MGVLLGRNFFLRPSNIFDGKGEFHGELDLESAVTRWRNERS
jgi:hypothetical protein